MNKDKEKILALYSQANNLYEESEFTKDEEKYNEIVTIIAQREAEERVRIDEILRKEEGINSLFEKASSLYRNNKIKEAQNVYRECLKNIEDLKEEG